MLSSIIFEDYSPLGRVFYQPSAHTGVHGLAVPRRAPGELNYSARRFDFRSHVDPASPRYSQHRAAHVSHVRCSVLPECRSGVTPDTRLRRQLQFKDVLLTPDTNWKLWRKFIGGNYLLPKSQILLPRTKINNTFSISVPPLELNSL